MGVKLSRYLKLFGRELIFEVFHFQPGLENGFEKPRFVGF